MTIIRTFRNQSASAPSSANAVLHGDCITRMAGLPSNTADLILTDPPYLVSYRDRDGRTVANDDNTDWLKPAFAQMHRVLKDDSFCVSFYGWQATGLFLDAAREAGFRVAGHMVFVKKYASSKRYLAHHHEQAFLFAKGRPGRELDPMSDVMGWAYTGNKHHPTQKPVEPLAQIIQAFTAPGDLVLDPFCGSGSTLVAAKSCGRLALGIELDADHCTTARRRLAQAHQAAQAA
jgi:site-specific DNA-methyltransferase (adenine-specific)